MLGIPLYFWRLLPGNPILLRVVATASKRKRDLLARCLYLGLLIGVVVLAIGTSGGGGKTGLDTLTATSEQIFRQMSYLQLGLVALLAPIFTAGAITQEKDAQTYDILLATPLTNGQIVLGTLASRLFFIIALLLSGIPIFAITKIFGGVAISDVAVSCFIAAATACVTARSPPSSPPSKSAPAARSSAFTCWWSSTSSAATCSTISTSPTRACSTRIPATCRPTAQQRASSPAFTRSWRFRRYSPAPPARWRAIATRAASLATGMVFHEAVDFFPGVHAAAERGADFSFDRAAAEDGAVDDVLAAEIFRLDSAPHRAGHT
ncbi:MAG: ABC transporter permease [Tepidisphaeraceae bacterium]